MRFYLLPLLVACCPLCWHAQTPDDQAEILEQVRAQALAYSKNLPDFICDQVTRREVTIFPEPLLGVAARNRLSGSTAQHLPVDTIEQQLAYFDGQESYKLVKVNGRVAHPGEPTPAGLSSTGEFGTTLARIFDPATKTAFQWKGVERLRRRPVYVFSFQVSPEYSGAEITAGSARAIVGYHGTIYADRDSKQVLRITSEVDAPPDFPLQDVKHVLDYGPAAINGQEFLLPLTAEMLSRTSEDFMNYGRVGGHSREVQMRNGVKFLRYRKYTAESHIEFQKEPDTK